MKTTSFRLPPELLRALERAAARAGRPKADLVRAALEQYLAHGDKGAGWTLGQLADELMTYKGSGVGDLGTRGEARLRERFRARRHRSR